MEARTLVIGDVHGGLRALKQVLERAEVTSADKLVFLGDYADGWSETAQLIDFLIELNQRQQCVFMIGNHDLWLMDWLEIGKEDQIWLSNGGLESIGSYQHYSAAQKRNHFLFFQNMRGYWIDGTQGPADEVGDQRLFLHAGFTSHHGPHRETFPSNFSWDRTLWETAIAVAEDMDENHIYYPRRLKLFKEIFIGHTATTRYKTHLPIKAKNVWNMDTGAGFGGKLSIMNIHTKQYWQSDFVNLLYPDERGRRESG